jgi:RecB family exonuclease
VGYQKIEKLPDPSGPAASRGNVVHDAFEKYVGFEDQPYPKAFERWRPQLDHLIATSEDVFPEMMVSLTRHWKPTTWARGKIRAKLDLVYIPPKRATIGVVDYKTGKVYDYHEAQLELYAVLLFHKYDWVKVVEAADWYLDQGDEIAEHTYRRGEYEAVLLPRWKAKVEADLTRKDWPAKRNRFCKWCAFNSKNGGPCVEGA